MLYLLQALSGWLLAGVGLGVFVGFLTCEPERPSKWIGWAIFAPLFLAGGAVVAYLQLLPGRYGFWLETALLLSFAYILGCLLGCLLHRLFAAAPKVDAKALAAKPSALYAIDVEQEMRAAVLAPSAETAPTRASDDAPSEGGKALTSRESALAAIVAEMRNALVADAPTVDAKPPAAKPAVSSAIGVEPEIAAALAPAVAVAPVPRAEPAPKPASGDALSEGVKALTGQAAAAVAETRGAPVSGAPTDAKALGAKPSALSAIDAPAVAAAPAPRTEPAPKPASGYLQPEGVNALTGHASALDVAIQAALATNKAAQALLAARAPAPVAEIATAGATDSVDLTPIRPQSRPRPETRPETRPESRAESRADEDNLQLIRGIGEIVAQHLHGLDIWRFAQIAEWTPEKVAWIEEKLPHHGPIAPKYWIAQARLLAGGIDTDFSRAFRAKRAPHHAPLEGASVEQWHRALPQAIAPDANDELYAGKRPLSLLDPPMGEWDDLTRIAGIDSALAARLSALGIWTYAQIAHWSPENARWIGAHLASPARVEQETWIAQAKALILAASQL